MSYFGTFVGFIFIICLGWVIIRACQLAQENNERARSQAIQSSSQSQNNPSTTSSSSIPSSNTIPMGSDDISSMILRNDRGSADDISTLKFRNDMGRILITDDTIEPSTKSTSSTGDDHNDTTKNDTTTTTTTTIMSADFGDHDVFAVDEPICSICLIEYDHGDEIQRNAIDTSSSLTSLNNRIRTSHTSLQLDHCNHIFHPTCISKWIQDNHNKECPCCRRPFIILSSSSPV